MKLLGILNVTNDSFSDGGEFVEFKKAISKANFLVQEGADIIDVGAQSSNVNSKIIDVETEIQRIEPIIKDLQFKKIKVSVDTYKSKVIQKCLDLEVDYINNITGFNDIESIEVLLDKKDNLPNLICMFSHNHSVKAEYKSELTPEKITDVIIDYMDKKINQMVKMGIPLEKIIVDPGMGFFLGADPVLSFTVLKNIQRLKKIYKRILISVSRKSFIGNHLGILPPKERNSGTLACELYLYDQGVDFIRTHDVKQLKYAVSVWDNLKGNMFE